jgi:SAM-dependent methyltransferase
VEQPESIEISQLLEEIQSAVDERRRMAAYPPELEAELAEHFERVQEFRVRGDMPWQPRSPEALSEPLGPVGWFARSRINIESKVPGGKLAHRAVGGVTARQVQGALHMVQEYTETLHGVVGELAANDVAAFKVIDSVQARIDALDERLQDLQRRYDSYVRALGHDPSNSDPPWFDSIALERFRGERDVLMHRYEGLADRFVGKGPVLDFGCGRGDFLHLLAAREVAATGAELDPQIAAVAKDEGLPVVCANGFDILADIPAGGLGGLVSLQVIEHMERGVLLHFIDEARRVLRPGGLVVFETPNPRSLFVHASSFWLDATHVRLVDPEYLAVVMDMAGFHDVEIEYRSPLPPPMLIEGDEAGDALPETVVARNARRLNQLVFAACDYAVIAVR